MSLSLVCNAAHLLNRAMFYRERKKVHCIPWLYFQSDLKYLVETHVNYCFIIFPLQKNKDLIFDALCLLWVRVFHSFIHCFVFLQFRKQLSKQRQHIRKMMDEGKNQDFQTCSSSWISWAFFFIVAQWNRNSRCQFTTRSKAKFNLLYRMSNYITSLKIASFLPILSDTIRHI